MYSQQVHYESYHGNMYYYDNIIVTSKNYKYLPKMILPFTGDTVLTVPTKDYTTSKSMYTCT